MYRPAFYLAHPKQRIELGDGALSMRGHRKPSSREPTNTTDTKIGKQHTVLETAGRKLIILTKRLDTGGLSTKTYEFVHFVGCSQCPDNKEAGTTVCCSSVSTQYFETHTTKATTRFTVRSIANLNNKSQRDSYSVPPTTPVRRHAADSTTSIVMKLKLS